MQLRKLFLATIILALAFGRSLFDLARLAANDGLFSYIPLIPLISLYLVWSQKKNLPPVSKPARKLAAFFFAGGLAAIIGCWLAVRFTSKPALEDYLAFNICAFLLIFIGLCAWLLGKEILRTIAFPVSLLVFMIPLPVVFRNSIETFLQYGSAAVANGLFTLSGMPFLQDGLNFQLSTITLQVAPECSGIHSSLVLFITSLLAGHLFLRSPWKRTVLALVVIPLALLRNGFRVFVLGQLCVHIDPEMIDSPIHHHGGPLFFALSLIPFFLLLIYLKKTERANHQSSSQTSKK
jgi:exosortase C (VPDSG-CTERM-specific)